VVSPAAPASHQAGAPLCASCGIIALSEHSQCSLCKAPYGHPRIEAPATNDGSYWVAVRCSFQCRSCSFLSPLDELDIDGSVECGQCGMHQRFDVSAWNEALAFAHEVGDLAFPPPEGRHPHPAIWIGTDNPHTSVGYTEQFGEHRQSSTYDDQGVTMHRSLFIQATPGHPVCEQCGVPLEVTLGQGQTTTRCAKCNATAQYALPTDAQSYSEALCGVVASNHGIDQKRARLESVAGGPVALKCPECGAALSASRDRVIQCAFCGASALIPTQARLRDASATLVPEIWWMAFSGPSAKRHSLEWPTLEDPDADLMAKAEGDEAVKKLLMEKKSKTLELAPVKSGVHLPQLALAWLLPLAALALGFALTLLLGLADAVGFM
jgi:hypothetical protein